VLLPVSTGGFITRRGGVKLGGVFMGGLTWGGGWFWQRARAVNFEFLIRYFPQLPRAVEGLAKSSLAIKWRINFRYLLHRSRSLARALVVPELFLTRESFRQFLTGGVRDLRISFARARNVSCDSAEIKQIWMRTKSERANVRRLFREEPLSDQKRFVLLRSRITFV